MVHTILLVRSRQELTDEIMGQINKKFGDVEYIDVEPRTPEELDDMVIAHNAVAVILRENPLPVRAMQRVPCIPLRPGQPLQRLVSIEPVVAPL